MNVDFDAVFGTKASNNDVKPSAGKISHKCDLLITALINL